MRNLSALAFLSAVSSMNVSWRGEQQETCHTSPQGGLTREQVENLLAETTGYHRGLPFGTQLDNARLLAQSVLRPVAPKVERTFKVRPAATGPDLDTVMMNDLRARARLSREAAIAFDKASNVEQLRVAIEDNSAHWADGETQDVTAESFATVKGQLVKREQDRFDHYSTLVANGGSNGAKWSDDAESIRATVNAAAAQMRG